LETRAAVGHLDRCWLDPVQKSTLREVDGRIGLRQPVSS
jgi:peptide/nickel transport system ATP-binding protein/oligopeptide transport system ATP-binding protein